MLLSPIFLVNVSVPLLIDFTDSFGNYIRLKEY